MSYWHSRLSCRSFEKSPGRVSGLYFLGMRVLEIEIVEFFTQRTGSFVHSPVQPVADGNMAT